VLIDVLIDELIDEIIDCSQVAVQLLFSIPGITIALGDAEPDFSTKNYRSSHPPR